ncbi:hypothetical protein HYW20_01435 [Candidatus Woesearchaeota archaeon]|nr:hypothetical protein [Candidatus Woesearchaeota archaeon]
MQNKKSQVEDWLPLLGIIIFMVILLVFYPSHSIAGTKAANNKIDFDVMSKDSDQLLLNYLKIKLDDKNIADAIVTYQLTKDSALLNQMKSNADNFFSKSDLNTESSTWSLEMKPFDENMIIVEPERARTDYILRKELSRTLIPAYYFNKPIEIKLFLVQTKYTP